MVLACPPGFRFIPSDREMVDYLVRKTEERSLQGMEPMMKVVTNDEIYKSAPSKEQIQVHGVDSRNGQKVWFFFISNSEVQHKCFNSTRSLNDGTGYWKTVTSDESIRDIDGKPYAFKVSLAFYTGVPPNGRKTCWMMDEYRLAEDFVNNIRTKRNEYVLGRIRRTLIQGRWDL